MGAAALLGVLGAVAAAFFLLGDEDNGHTNTTLEKNTELTAARTAALQEKATALKTELQKAEANPAEGEAAGDPVSADAGGAAPSNSPTARSFSKLEHTLPGQAGIAITAPGILPAPVPTGSVSNGSAWSTIKLALALRTTLDAGGPGGLSTSQKSLISRALTASDNAAALELWNGLVSNYGSPSAAATATAKGFRRAGDSETQVSTVGRDGFSPYGQTEWSLAHQAQFTGALAGGCLADPATTSYLLGEMGQVVSDQSWGLGSAGVPAKFKGGWGPGTSGGYLVRQTGVLQTSKGPMVLSIAALPSDGSLGSGAAMLTTIAKWAVKNASPPTSSGC